MKLILTTEYFGPISSYALMLNANEVWIEKNETYQKKSFRNRAMVSSFHGSQRLSVPLLAGKTSAPIEEVQISYDEDWVSDHLKSMEMNYQNTPFYEYYIDDIVSLLGSRPSLLVELNDLILDYFLELLDFPRSRLQVTTSYQSSYDVPYLDLRKLKSKKSRQPLIRELPYRQPFDDRIAFINDQSILDLLFCVGPEMELYLENVSK